MALILRILFVTIAIFHKSADSMLYNDRKYIRTALGDNIDRASMKLLQAEYDSASKKNLISSPLGVFTLLSMYAAGAQGDISNEIAKFLGAFDSTELLNSYGKLNKMFSNMDASFITLINKIYVSDKSFVDKNFASITANLFDSEVEKINFDNPKNAVAVINKWAEEKTKNHLKNPVSDDAIDNFTVLALFNIICFQGHWNIPFDARLTSNRDFYVNKTTTVKKPTMHLVEPLSFTSSSKLGARIIELPYKENNFRMVLLLPDDLDGLPTLIKKVAETGVLEEVFSLRGPSDLVKLYLPKFSVQSEFNLNVILPKVGVSKMFTEKANGIIMYEGVEVSKAFQKAFIKVDEEGAVAGAFTGAFITNRFGSEVEEFIVDHPFLYFILYEDKILFVGTYTN